MLNKVRSKYESHSLLFFFVAIVNRLRVFDYFVFYYVYRVPFDVLKRGLKDAPDLYVEVVDDVANLEPVVSINDKRDIFVSRIERGCFCVVVFYGGYPVGYVWGEINSPHVEERYGFKIEISSDEAFYFDSYIKPDYRGLGLLKYMVREFIHHAEAKHGKKFLSAIIEITNKHSVRVHESMQYRRKRAVLSSAIRSRRFDWTFRRYT